jgi:hypothetical protein
LRAELKEIIEEIQRVLVKLISLISKASQILVKMDLENKKKEKEVKK